MAHFDHLLGRLMSVSILKDYISTARGEITEPDNVFSFQKYLDLFKTLALFIYIYTGLLDRTVAPAGAGLLGEQPSLMTRDSS